MDKNKCEKKFLKLIFSNQVRIAKLRISVNVIVIQEYLLNLLMASKFSQKDIVAMKQHLEWKKLRNIHWLHFY